MKKGDNVKQVQPAPFTGVVVDMKIDADTGDIQYLVEGSGGARWFTGEQVEVV